MIAKTIAKITAALSPFAVAAVAQAAAMNQAATQLGTSLTNVDTSTNAWTQLGVFINYVLTLLGLVTLIFLLYAGVTILTSQGNEDKVAEARKIIIYAVVGVIIIALAYAINSWIFESSFFK